jgi:hypothetical protein
MDRRRSFYVAARQDNFDVPAPDDAGLNLTDIPYVTPVNDNVQTEDRLWARCGALLRRLIRLHSLN